MRSYTNDALHSSGKQPSVRPALMVGVIFLGIGLLFAVLGVVFLIAGGDMLPQVFRAENWLGETSGEVALPMIGVVFSGVGAVFIVIGAILLGTDRRAARLQEELERFGTRVTGTVADIYVDRTVRVNGRSPLRIMVQAQNPFTGQTQTLRGPMVWETALSTSDAVEVLFDPQDEKKYIVKL